MLDEGKQCYRARVIFVRVHSVPRRLSPGHAAVLISARGAQCLVERILIMANTSQAVQLFLSLAAADRAGLWGVCTPWHVLDTSVALSTCYVTIIDTGGN